MIFLLHGVHVKYQSCRESQRASGNWRAADGYCFHSLQTLENGRWFNVQFKAELGYPLHSSSLTPVDGMDEMDEMDEMDGMDAVR